LNNSNSQFLSFNVFIFYEVEEIKGERNKI
jgi:hypothetical protein